MYISHLREEKNLENQSKIIEEGGEVAQYIAFWSDTK